MREKRESGESESLKEMEVELEKLKEGDRNCVPCFCVSGGTCLFMHVAFFPYTHTHAYAHIYIHTQIASLWILYTFDSQLIFSVILFSLPLFLLSTSFFTSQSFLSFT